MKTQKRSLATLDIGSHSNAGLERRPTPTDTVVDKKRIVWAVRSEPMLAAYLRPGRSNT
jgi:hypothetical protein